MTVGVTHQGSALTHQGSVLSPELSSLTRFQLTWASWFSSICRDNHAVRAIFMLFLRHTSSTRWQTCAAIKVSCGRNLSPGRQVLLPGVACSFLRAPKLANLRDRFAALPVHLWLCCLWNLMDLMLHCLLTLLLRNSQPTASVSAK